MEIIELNKESYQEWDEFCLKSDDAWFWHTSDWLEYSLAYKLEYNSRSLSFLVCDDTGIIGICPLILEEINDAGVIVKQFSNSGGGGYLPTPAVKCGLTIDRKERVLRSIFSRIDELAIELGVKRASWRFTYLGADQLSDRAGYNYLMRYDCLDNSLNTQIIDLLLPLEQLNHDVRKGHKYDIKRGERAYQVEIWDRQNIKKEIFDLYRLLHHKASGRVTRPIETFEMMYQWILSGKAILCGVKYGDKYIGFSLIITYKTAAYYASASDDPEIKVEAPIAHVIQWSVINWLKSHGYRYYEIGTQQFNLQLYDFPSKKDLDIASFKRGFGGGTWPFFRGEKFYDREYMKDVLSERLAILTGEIN